ncbi:MAG: PEP-utilizing enzyme [Sphaerochaetaceae bacterium]|jgi:pyruvate,water dikinase|nr:PEP-utilizing enzyme [Sphaerochaetaceae bacterium]MDD3940983.1 PEP-utilizing enzyme [Sphaerochaetaceae bacterium]MDX9939695.1 PEP-utilizing enzyme [Sphaerochaetaceae bacterium]
MDNSKVLAQFLGDKSFPVQWKNEEEKKLFWWFDDNHCPFPVSPMYFSLDGWWGPTCEYLFRRFDVPSGITWEAKRINGYVYTAIEGRDAKDAEEAGKYYGWIMPTYATNFLDWWENRYLPEVFTNFKYIDEFDAENATLPELMIYLEEMIDIQERNFRLHWVLNWAQFQASMGFNGVVNSLIGNVDQDLLGKVNVSRKDRNWDSLKALYQLKEEVKKDAELKKLFTEIEVPADIEAALKKTAKGKAFLNDVFEYAKEFGYKAIYTHEYVFPLYIEDQKPILEQIKSYLATDFNYHDVYNNCIAEQDRAIAYLRDQIKNKSAEDKAKFEDALALNLAMLPLTPDHHFYFDQGTYARMRLVLLRVARKMVKEGLLDDQEDIMMLEYEQLRRYVADPKNYPGRKLIADAKAEIEKAHKITPRDWVGTVTQANMYEEPYHTLWGYPEKFERENDVKVKGTIQGLPASPGVVEGIARVVKSPAEFNDVKRGEILVCIMTNPAWVVVFSKIAGIVTDSGGVLSHSAVVAREFMIPAVVGTGTATREIKSGDKVRVDGDKGVVTILS